LFRVEYIIGSTNENMVEFVGVGLFVKNIDGNDVRLESKGQKRNTKYGTLELGFAPWVVKLRESRQLPPGGRGGLRPLFVQLGVSDLRTLAPLNSPANMEH
jgi:hypothetical protein